jgi:hypothetical protein
MGALPSYENTATILKNRISLRWPMRVVLGALFNLITIFGFISSVHAQPSGGQSQLLSAPIIQENTKTFTMIKVGDNGPAAKVTLDTGSSMLVLEEQFVKNYRAGQSNNLITMGYGNGAKIVQGKVVYASVSLNTNPQIIAQDVPILMVPNGTFRGHAGIMGVEMSNQTSVWMHLPAPYNQMMIINSQKSIVSFGTIPESEMDTFAQFHLKEGKCNNRIKPEPAYENITCWATRKIPVTYTFQLPNGRIVYKAQYNTIFDTGGVLTHFFLQPIPGQIKPFIQNKTFNGNLSMVLDTSNQGAVAIPATQVTKIFKNKRNVVNSGYQVFYEKCALFNSRDGIVGFK